MRGYFFKCARIYPIAN